jgi:hypothetical protein
MTRDWYRQWRRAAADENQAFAAFKSVVGEIGMLETIGASIPIELRWSAATNKRAWEEAVAVTQHLLAEWKRAADAGEADPPPMPPRPPIA